MQCAEAVIIIYHNCVDFVADTLQIYVDDDFDDGKTTEGIFTELDFGLEICRMVSLS